MASSSAPVVTDSAPTVGEVQQPTLPKILKSDFLTKEGALLKSWKLCWFELTPMQMTYYSDNVRLPLPFLFEAPVSHPA